MEDEELKVSLEKFKEVQSFMDQLQASVATLPIRVQP